MLVSDVAEMAPIRAIEKELAEAAGHGIECFETYADLAVESGKSEEGAYDEIMGDGRTLMDHFRSDMIKYPKRCECTVYEEVGPNPFLQEEDDLAADRAWDAEHGIA